MRRHFLNLRIDLIELKKAELSKLRRVQEANYNRVLDSDATNVEVLRGSNDALDYFEKIAQRVEKISNYPHFVPLLRYIGLAALPSIFSISIKLFQVARPIIQSI